MVKILRTLQLANRVMPSRDKNSAALNNSPVKDTRSTNNMVHWDKSKRISYGKGRGAHLKIMTAYPGWVRYSQYCVSLLPEVVLHARVWRTTLYARLISRVVALGGRHLLFCSRGKTGDVVNIRCRDHRGSLWVLGDQCRTHTSVHMCRHPSTHMHTHKKKKENISSESKNMMHEEYQNKQVVFTSYFHLLLVCFSRKKTNKQQTQYSIIGYKVSC